MHKVIQDSKGNVHTVFGIEGFKELMDEGVYYELKDFIDDERKEYLSEKAYLEDEIRHWERENDSKANALIEILNLLDETLIKKLKNDEIIRRPEIRKITEEIKRIIENEV